VFTANDTYAAGSIIEWTTVLDGPDEYRNEREDADQPGPV